MSFTPYNAPLLAPILGDREVASYFSIAADIKAMVTFEVALAKAQAGIGQITKEACAEICEVLEGFEADIPALACGSARDGLVVPAFVKDVQDKLSPEHQASFHKWTTSQDLIDTSAMVRLRDVVAIITARLDTCLDLLTHLKSENSAHTLMGFTRMQAALPISAVDRLSAWESPLIKSATQLKALEFPVQVGGPVGAASAFDGRRDDLARSIAKDLMLVDNGRCWHTDRTPMIAIGQALTTMSGALGKIGQDITLMAQMGDDHILLRGGGGSSAMPHKNNPVAAEALVTLARFTSVQMAGLNTAMVHEQERSGASWALEWMIMPQLAVAASAALINAQRVLDQIQQIGQPHISNGKPT